MNRTALISIAVNTGKYQDFVTSIIDNALKQKSDYACVANVHMLVQAYKQPGFAQIVSNASIITPDGIPIGWALRLLYGIKQDRVSGMDLLPDLLKHSEEKKLPVFFYGGDKFMLETTRQFLKKYHPNLPVAGMYSPPFRKLSLNEESFIIQMINDSEAKLVFVILGCPKQEQWMASMKGRIGAFTIGIGGALPVLIGKQKRAPRWMQSAGLEWLYRLVQEPKRLFKRYASTNSFFIYLLLKAYLQKKLAYRIA